jgi:hypothetical protein
MKKLVIVAIVVFCLLTFAFLWKEHFDLSTTINADKINAYATSLAAIFTAITVFLLYKQNKQQIKETKAASQPDLFPGELNIYTEDTTMPPLSTTGEINSYPQFYYYSNEPIKTKDISPRVFIDLHNVGFGVAKNIKVKWIYDKEEVQKYFIDVYKVKGYDLGKTEFDFIAADKSIKLEIPEDYMRCFGRLLNRNVPGGEPNQKPKANLELKYLDIHNEPYTKEFELITFSPNSFVQIRFEQLFN